MSKHWFHLFSHFLNLAQWLTHRVVFNYCVSLRMNQLCRGAGGTLNYLCNLTSSIILIFPGGRMHSHLETLPLQESGIKQKCTFFVLLLALLWFYTTRAFAFHLMSRMHLSFFSSVYSLTSRNGVFPCSLWVVSEDAILPFIPISLQGHSSGGRFTWVCLGPAISYHCSSSNLLRIHLVCPLGPLSCSPWIPVQGTSYTGLHLLLSLVF